MRLEYTFHKVLSLFLRGPCYLMREELTLQTSDPKKLNLPSSLSSSPLLSLYKCLLCQALAQVLGYRASQA